MREFRLDFNANAPFSTFLCFLGPPSSFVREIVRIFVFEIFHEQEESQGISLGQWHFYICLRRSCLSHPANDNVGDVCIFGSTFAFAGRRLAFDT